MPVHTRVKPAGENPAPEDLIKVTSQYYDDNRGVYCTIMTPNNKTIAAVRVCAFKNGYGSKVSDTTPVALKIYLVPREKPKKLFDELRSKGLDPLQHQLKETDFHYSFMRERLGGKRLGGMEITAHSSSAVDVEIPNATLAVLQQDGYIHTPVKKAITTFITEVKNGLVDRLPREQSDILSGFGSQLYSQLTSDNGPKIG